MRGMGARVIVVSHGFQQRYERGFVNALAINGIQVCLIGSDDTDPGRLLPGVELINLRGSQDPRRSLGAKAANLVRYHLRLIGYVARNRDAVVHTIGLFRFAILTGIVENFVLSRLSRRLVVTVHDLLPHQRHGRWNQIVYRRIWRIPDRLVVHTQRMRAALIERFAVDPARIVVMEHGINDEIAPRAPRPDAIARVARKRGAPLRLLIFGAVAPSKGVDLLLEAFAGLDERFELVIAGRCLDRAYAGRIAALIASNRNRERITWRDEFVPEHEVDGYFVAADVVVLPYRHIDQSGVLLEALGQGVPIVATDVGAFAHYVSAADGVIVRPGDVGALRAGILRVADDLAAFDRASIERRARRFLWSETVKSLLDVYA